jgi:hypothetical protein
MWGLWLVVGLTAWFSVWHVHQQKQLTNECISAFDAIGFNWTLQEYVTWSFDERIEDLEDYTQMHSHVNVN